MLRPGESQFDELAFAHFAARRAGLEVASVALLHLDPDFVRGAGPPGARELLRHTDVTREVAPLSRDLAARVAAQAARARGRRAAGGRAVAALPAAGRLRVSRRAARSRCPATGSAGCPALRPQHYAALREAGASRESARCPRSSR